MIPFFTHDGTTYMNGGEERVVSRMRTGIDAALRGWTGPVRLSFEGREYAYAASHRTTDRCGQPVWRGHQEQSGSTTSSMR